MTDLTSRCSEPGIKYSFYLSVPPGAMGGYAGTGGGYAGAVRNGGRPPFDRNPTTWVPQAPMRSGKPNKINKTFWSM